MIRSLRRWASGPSDSGDTVESLRAQVDELRAQNDKLRRAMRQCVDCEYRIEVLAQRSTDGQTAAGGEAAP